MALADRLTDAPRGMTGHPCSVGELERSLKGAELDALRAMLYELGWSQRAIWEALKDEGHMVGHQSINNHRGRRCRCYNGRAA